MLLFRMSLAPLILLSACATSNQTISNPALESKLDPAQVADAVFELAAFENLNQECGQRTSAHENEKVEIFRKLDPSMVIVPSTHPDGFAKSCLVAGIETLQNAPPRLCDLSLSAVSVAMAFAGEVAGAPPEVLERNVAHKIRNECGRGPKSTAALSNSKIRNLCIKDHSVLAGALALRRYGTTYGQQATDNSVERLIDACSLSSLISYEKDRCREIALFTNFPDRARRHGITSARLYGKYAEQLVCQSILLH